MAGRTLWGALALAAAPAVVGAQGGTSTAPVRYGTVLNQAVATFTTDGFSDSSLAGATVVVARQAALSLTGAFTATVAPGQRRTFLHQLTNRGTNSDAVRWTAAIGLAWPLAVYQDADGDGRLTAADPLAAGTLTIAPGATVSLFVVTDVPDSAAIGATNDIAIAATSGNDPVASVTTADHLTVVAQPTANVLVAKTVDHPSGTIGDTLRYTITFTNAGDGDARGVALADTLPRGLALIPGSLVLDGRPVTDAADADSGTAELLGDGRALARATIGTLPAGASGSFTLATQVTREATNGSLANIALISFGDSTRAFAVSAATTAMTAITVATLGLTEQLVGSRVVTVGSPVQLRLSYANSSAIAARNAVLVDTLPLQYLFVSSAGATVTPATSPSGARIPQVVTWTLGTLGAGTTGTRDLYVRIDGGAGDTSVTDHAHVTADNALTQYAQASTSIALFAATDLHLTKTAGVLEASIGDAVPYAVVVRNAGVATLQGVIVRDRLPGGMRYAPNSLSGADSASVAGQDLTIFLGTPLAPGRSAAVRYAAVIATPDAGAALENRAVAEAENGLVRSDTARAVVSQRRVLAMRERTMIGKVWLDRDDDGVQQAGEEGVAGVQVWDANGDFAVTDKEGRFSFRNVATGTHALRLDPAGIPRGFVLPSRADEVITLHADGWSLPSASIRLVPRAASAAACRCDSTVVKATAVALAGAPVAAPVVAPTVAPLLSAAERAAAARRELIEGAGLRIVAPLDGTVLATPRFFAGVRGPAGTQVGLYDGATLLRSGAVRGDGTTDFLNVELTPGPHHLRIAALDTSSGMRGDSIMVHLSGAPARFVPPAELPALRRDAAEPVVARVRVLDSWNVPVADQPMITLTARGAVVASPDQDASSVGVQLRADAAGWVSVPLRAGLQVGDGELRLDAADARASIPLRVFASVRPLVVTGVGQVGVGGAPSAFGAVTVQGAVTQNTSVAVTWDSRRAGGSGDFFQRGYDARADEQFATVGDNSVSKGVAPTTKAVSARVERGMDWLTAGDVQTLGFGRDGELGAYRRSVTGVSGRLGTGALVWHGFGSMTQQTMERTQLRADGSTGPYAIGGAIRAGTEVVVIEVRARDNAARVVTSQQLLRLTDYQIDYATGVVLLRLPVPSTDSYGNPVFVVTTAERTSGGAAHFVGGMRMDADAARVLRLGTGIIDSLVVGVSGVRDEATTSALALAGTPSFRNLLSADLRLRRGALSLGGNVLRSQTMDSTGTATSATGSWALLGDRLTLDGRWMSVDAGMGGADPRLSSALTETTIGLTSKLSATNSLRLHHAESRFQQYGITRATTGLSAEQVVQGHRTKQDLTLLNESGAAGASSSALTARVSTALTSRVESWVDATHSLTAPTVGQGGRPNQVGTGITVQLPAGLRLDGSHRVMRTPGDSVTYGVTTAQLRAEGILGGQVWTGLEQSTAGLHDDVRAGHSALLGWNQQLPLGAGWQLTSLYERRVGLSRASLAEPERALPFVQAERDRWSAAAGLAWMPGGDRARFSMNAEAQSGQAGSSSRFQLSGDAALNAGLAVIALNDWAGRRDLTQGNGAESRQDRSLLGLAMRPVTTNRFNALTKVEWRRTVSPTGTALLSTSARDLRLIASSDAVWAPVSGTELSARYAMRVTTSDVAGDSAQRLHVADHFAGGRIDRRVRGAVHLRADGRLLMETGSRTALWNVAPSLLYDLQGHLTLEAGYRLGALRDPDFAAVGGAGAFATVGFRFTEGTLASPAAFWRERIANDR